ncbi:unnamed protein product [Ixodes hexagonus]
MERCTLSNQDGAQTSSSSSRHGQDGYSGIPPWPQPGYPPSQPGTRVPWTPVTAGHVPRLPARVFQPRSGRDPAPPRAGGNGVDNACFFCGRRRHERVLCPASQATCFLCGKLGHFAVACQSRRPPSAAFSYDRRQASFPVPGRGSRRTYADRQSHGMVDPPPPPEMLPSVDFAAVPASVETTERGEGGVFRRDAFMAEITLTEEEHHRDVRATPNPQ